MSDSFLNPLPPLYTSAAGIRTIFGQWMPVGSRAYYVNEDGITVDGGASDTQMNADTRSTVNAALNLCRANRGDRVYVMPGYTEDISTADQWSNIKAGVKVICVGDGDDAPKFTWTAAAGQILVDQASFEIHGGRWEFAGSITGTTALTVTEAIKITAPGVGLFDLFGNVGVDADQLVSKAITASDAAKRLRLGGLRLFGNSTAECPETIIEIAGADEFAIVNSIIHATTDTTTVGVLRLIATAAVGGYIDNCSFANRKALSVNAVTGVAASSGICRRTFFGILDDATLAGWSTPASWQFDGECTTANLLAETGARKTVVST
jgi:hypothetical protein